MRALAVLALVALALPGCDRVRNAFDFGSSADPVFDGERYRGQARSEARNRQSFIASASPVSNSLEGAVLAAEHEGIKHCIQYYGTSDIDWEVGPDTPRDALRIDGDTLTLVGTCKDP
ncbi:hypothetical protein [Pseudoponticoccus marisrubri]|uniref:Lipoprotein n=1 Tax=Pseudoponticoccus marisrubri TaxID=1685382 RepID=A0A0W7WEN8_9RHOB|nr:hypothetical protein [Pseudoponticoccus marisrubri]KUF09082.1 hypothetical protein AVJ23_19340 [Pseudoponticoccus marisrubri]